MRAHFKVVTFFLFVIAIFSNTLTVYSAEKQPQLKVGIVDVTLVTRGSLLAKDIARQIDAKRTKYMNEKKVEEASLRKLDEELQKKRVILSSEAITEEQRKFRSKRTALNRMVQSKNQALLKFRRGTDIYWNKSMQKALSDVVKKHGYNLVFRFTPELILVRPDSIEISNLVLNQLNKNITKYIVTPSPVKLEK
jgi:Skp family chaperone for outer membrane proteins